jgi:predicted  nucleic acid-binding Zn-ribbon protein
VTESHRIQGELEQAVAARAEHAQLARRLAGSAQHLEDLDRRILDLRRQLGDEAADVERLESLSAARIWSRLKGSHLADLERETAEREAARYAVAEAEARREVMRRERAALESRIAELGDVEARCRSAMAAKEAWVTELGGGSARELAEIAERRGELTALDNEAREAFTAGRAAHDLLARASSLLGSAGSWSMFDTFGGGGLLTDMMKYDKVDQATETLRRADLALAAFSRELADVDLPAVGGVRVEQMMRTFDVWFDNVFSDLAVRARIEDAAHRVTQATDQVERALGALAEKGRAIERELADLDDRRQQLLVG